MCSPCYISISGDLAAKILSRQEVVAPLLTKTEVMFIRSTHLLRTCQSTRVRGSGSGATGAGPGQESSEVTLLKVAPRYTERRHHHHHHHCRVTRDV